MSYREFTLELLLRRFPLRLQERRDLFATVPPHPPSALLAATLEINIPIALAISTEKARSELIIAPILVEVVRVLDGTVSLFSGIDFTISPEEGLNGVSDFLLSRSPEQFVLRAPELVVIEAKNENVRAGIAQCGATMLAAQRFNVEQANAVTTIYGAVTTGDNWRFLMLEDQTLSIDQPQYTIQQVDRILGIFLHMLRTPVPVTRPE